MRGQRENRRKEGGGLRKEWRKREREKGKRTVMVTSPENLVVIVDGMMGVGIWVEWGVGGG